MSGLTFRPRPIDITKLMPIVRADFSEDGVHRGVPQMPTGMDPEDEEEKHIQEAIERSLSTSQAKAEAEIPTPTVVTVESWFKEKVQPFHPPEAYIAYSAPQGEALDKCVEYDLEPDDYDFLNRYNSANTKKPMSEETMEFIIDRLEKLRAKNKFKPFSVEKAEQFIGNERNTSIKAHHIVAVYNYWTEKRKGLKWPLIIRLQPPPNPDDPSPFVAFRPHPYYAHLQKRKQQQQQQNRKNDRGVHRKLTQLRHDFERARMLLETVKKREKTKRELINVLYETFELQREELHAPVEKKRKRRSQHTKEPKTKVVKKKKTKTKTEEVEPLSSSSDEEETNEQTPNLFTTTAPSTLPTTPETEGNLTRQDIVEIMQRKPLLPYPSFMAGRIFIGPKVPPFRGRARVGRGGRLLFDRMSIPWATGPRPRPFFLDDDAEQFELNNKEEEEEKDEYEEEEEEEDEEDEEEEDKKEKEHFVEANDNLLQPEGPEEHYFADYDERQEEDGCPSLSPMFGIGRDPKNKKYASQQQRHQHQLEDGCKRTEMMHPSMNGGGNNNNTLTTTQATTIST
ncbi:putative High mobility group protein B3 [Balamuthia mandrillaris]